MVNISTNICPYFQLSQHKTWLTIFKLEVGTDAEVTKPILQGIIMWIPTHTYRSRPGKKYGPLRTNRPYSAWLLKAFDKVPHERLLCKAQYYGIDGSTLLWIQDFLSSRNRRVLLVVEGLSSQTAPVCSGVPQGSIIGPLMFLLFINDLQDYVKSCNVRLFADDSVLYRRIHRASDMQSLQDDMDNLLQWEQEWQMEFHGSKCQLLRITNKRKPFARDYDIHGHKLEEVESAKYLGVTIQKNLSWNIHIDQITKKANSTRAFIQRNLNHCLRETKSTCYLTLVRPLLEYACMVWDPHTAQNIQKLEAVHRRSARFVMNNY